MRNEGKEPTADGIEPETGSTYTSEAAHRPRRQKQQIIAGTAGVLAVLGVGGGIVASQAREDPATVTTATVGALPQAGTGHTEPPSPGASAGTAAATPAQGVTPTPGATPAPKAPQTQPQKAGEGRAAEEQKSAGGRVAALPKPEKTLRAVPHSRKVRDSDVTVVQRNYPEKKQTFKIASARADLTDYRELSWVADDSRRVGNAECTSKIRLSPDTPPRERPTLLLCWRLSAERSVYTVAVDRDGKPSVDESVAALEKRWNELG